MMGSGFDSDWFRERMRMLGVTQEDLGSAIDRDRSAASRLLSGALEFKAAHAGPIARILKSTPAEVLTRAGIDLGTLPQGNRSMPHTRVEAAIEAFKAGQIVVVTDDDDRENEGDLIISAVHCTPEKMAFIVRHTSGIVCAPLTREAARRLRLDPMVASNDAPLATAFTVSVDVRHGLTTGISAEERTNTVRALANPNMGAQDFVRPGHVFPLIARDGGVLVRTGHTEATTDLCRLAGLPEVGVICEMMNDDGTVMRGPQVKAFAESHGLRQVSIAEMVAYRQAREKLVERVSTFTVETSIGPITGHAYATPFDPVHHLAFVHGRIGDGENVPCRLHRADVIKDVFGGAPAIKAAIETFQEDGRGVLVYLRDGTVGVPATPTREQTNSETDRLQTWREIGVGAQILRDLGVRSIRLLTRSSHRYVALGGFGIEIAGLHGGSGPGT
jgi:3,4-dihydroxy 2-butanone 4-phosphate synthase / GTP cyclohydrolase II